jgi:hypothetical protein
MYGRNDEYILPGKPKNWRLLERPKHRREVEMKKHDG